MIATVLPFLLLGQTVQAAPATDWAELTRADIAAIDATMREAYPAFVDPAARAFSRRWQTSVNAARRGAAVVKDEAESRRILRRLVMSVRDEHVSLAFKQRSQPVFWTGFAIEYVQGRFLIRERDDEGPSTKTAYTRILSCDGQPIGRFARQRLDLNVTDWSVQGNRSFAAPLLLVDQGMPGSYRIKACEVVDGRASHRRTITFNWRAATPSDLLWLRAFQRRKHQPEFALEKLDDGGYWIHVPNFTDGGGNARLREQVRQSMTGKSQPRYVVIDVRGNGGGNSALGTLLAESLWGDGSAASPPPGAPKRWRDSPQLRSAVQQELLRAKTEVLDTLRQSFLVHLESLLAQSDHSPLIEEPSRGTDTARAPERARSGLQHVFVLTDGGCMSSCIMFVQQVKRMGAVQVGDPTNRNTRYGEEWISQPLPSRMATLYVPSAIFGWRSRELSSLPRLPWNGSAVDEAGLRTMISRAADRR